MPSSSSVSITGGWHSDGCPQLALLRRLAGLGICYPGSVTPSSSCGKFPCFPCSTSRRDPRTTEMACNGRDYPRYDVALNDQARPSNLPFEVRPCGPGFSLLRCC